MKLQGENFNSSRISYFLAMSRNSAFNTITTVRLEIRATKQKHLAYISNFE